MFVEIKGDKVFGVYFLCLLVGIGVVCVVEYYEVWCKVGQFVGVWYDKYVFDKVGLLCYFGDEVYVKMGVWVGVVSGVDDVQFFVVQLVCDQVFQVVLYVW